MNSTLQDYVCRDCGKRFVVSITATAFHGPCPDCGCSTFQIFPHVSEAPRTP